MTVTDRPGGDWDSHLLLLYRDETQRQDAVALWVQRGLDRGEKIFYTQLPDDAALLPELALRGVEVAEAARQGQFAILPLEDFFPAGGQAALVRGALEEGYPGVRLAARANAALDYLTEQGYQARDRTLDELCVSLPVSAMCQYDPGRTIGQGLAIVIDSHPDALRDAQMRLRRRAEVVFLAGEVDVASAPALTLFLQRACQRAGAAKLVIDLAELTFLDVTGCRAVIAGTGPFRTGGGTLFLRGVSGHLLKVMTLLGMDRLPAVELV